VIKIKKIQEDPTNRGHYLIVFWKKSQFFMAKEICHARFILY
jgi:hypothetical protein